MKGTFFLGAKETSKFEVREMEFAPLEPHQVLVENRACRAVWGKSRTVKTCLRLALM